jgi:hypothetical protein
LTDDFGHLNTGLSLHAMAEGVLYEYLPYFFREVEIKTANSVHIFLKQLNMSKNQHFALVGKVLIFYFRQDSAVIDLNP